MTSAKFDRESPFNALPPLPPKHDLETVPILKKAIAATRALAELKGAGDVIPNQTVLLSALALQEAKVSSEIENIVTTNDEMYRAFADDGKESDPRTKEVLRYNQALWEGYHLLKQGRPLGTTMFEKIASIIKEQDIKVRKLQGTRIAVPGGKTVYTPPEGEKLIRDLLFNLERFIYETTALDPLIKLAVIHYQFEAIHPFTDGNGRTGRILNILYLIEEKLLDIPILYLSQFIIRHKDAYYQLLQKVTEQSSWEEWVIYVLDAVEQTAKETCERIHAIRALMDTTTEKIKALLPAIYTKDLVEILFKQPYCKIKFIEEAGIAKRQSASKYLQELEKAGFLKGYKIGREMYYLNVPFFDLLSK